MQAMANDLSFANLNSRCRCDGLKNLTTPLLSKKNLIFKTFQPQNTLLTPLEHPQTNS
jgi:hypothetical protein